MPSPKSGSAGSAVSPAPPVTALDADHAIPGSQDTGNPGQSQATTGSQSQTKPYKQDKSKKSWIEIELLDEKNKPVSGEAYLVTLPDGETVAEGTLDDKGFARVDGIDPGTCKITFPNLEKQAWQPK
jgi:hypothetical protein